MRTLQKKGIRLIANVPINEHCLSIAKNLNLLLFDDLYFTAASALMFNFFHNSNVTSNIETHIRPMHSYNTRHSVSDFRIFPIHTDIRKRFILHSGVVLWNNFGTELKLEKSLGSFKNALRSQILAKHV